MQPRKHENTKKTFVVAYVSCLMSLLSVQMASAQVGPLAGTVEVAVGVRWNGEMATGGSHATETAPSGIRYSLFTANTMLSPTIGIEGSLSIRLAPTIEAGVRSSFGRSNLRTRISSDVEGIPDVEATETISQWEIEGALVVHLLNWRPTYRAVPFVSAGGGFLRHLHEGRTLMETGSVYHIGAGLEYVLIADGPGHVKATGLCVDLRGVLRKGGVAFDERFRLSPAVGASLFARF